MKVGIVITTHKKNYKKVIKCLLSVIKFCPENRHIVLFDNEGCHEKTADIPNIYPEVTYIHIKDQTNGGLTYTWNKGIDICLENECDAVILLNHDTEVNNTFHFLIDALGDKTKIGIYGPTTNKGSWAAKETYKYIKSNTLNISKIRDKRGICGFCLGLSKEVLLQNKFNKTHYFNPAYPWGGNEWNYCIRWIAKKGVCYVVRNCLVKHTVDRSWTKLKYKRGKNIKMPPAMYRIRQRNKERNNNKELIEKRVTNNINGPCVTVIGIKHPSNKPGMYFYFITEDWSAMTGSTAWTSATRPRKGTFHKVVQMRNNIEVWRGTVIVWNNQNGIHGRRHLLYRNKNWRIGDIIQHQ